MHILRHSMSLYDGLDVSSKTHSDDKTGSNWPSPGLKLLQSQIAQKKAALTQRDKSKNLGAAQASVSVSPVIDLNSRAKKAGDKIKGGIDSTDDQSASPLTTESLLKPRKPLVIDGPPLSFVAHFAKDEKTLIFGEVEIEDEYNPLVPNDYEKLVEQREEHKKNQREAAKKRDLEEREQRRKERLKREQEDEENVERQKRLAGAAIAPPPNLLEEDKKVLENPVPAFTPPEFKSGSRGLGIAAKIMEKYGYKQGAGLGRQGQGMSSALQVTKTSLRGGKIIHENMLKEEEDTASPPPPNPAPTVSSDPDGFAVPLAPVPSVPSQPPPITEVLKNPTKVVLLKNMVGSGEVDNELEPEVKEEMGKYGDVQKCLIYEMSNDPPVAPEEAVRIFVEFGKVDQAIKAVVDLNGRYFGGRMVKAGFYDVDKFQRFDLTS